MNKKFVFKSLSRFENEAGMFELESVGMSPEFNVPITVFNRDDEQFLQIAEEIGEAYGEAVGYSIEVIHVTKMLTVTKRGRRYFESRPLCDKSDADDILDIRDKIAFPKGVRFFDCEFFILYPLGEENVEEEYYWIAAVPCVA